MTIAPALRGSSASFAASAVRVLLAAVVLTANPATGRSAPVAPNKPPPPGDARRGPPPEPRTMMNHTPTAADVMERSSVTVAADTPLLEVLHLFVVARISGAAVVGDGGAVVGVIAASDLLRAVDQVFDDEIDDVPDGAQDESLSALRAADILTPDPIWVARDTPAAAVGRLMRERGIHRVLVGAEGHLEGIVTTFDLLRLLEHLPC